MFTATLILYIYQSLKLKSRISSLAPRKGRKRKLRRGKSYSLSRVLRKALQEKAVFSKKKRANRISGLGPWARTRFDFSGHHSPLPPPLRSTGGLQLPQPAPPSKVQSMRMQILKRYLVHCPPLSFHRKSSSFRREKNILWVFWRSIPYKAIRQKKTLEWSWKDEVWEKSTIGWHTFLWAPVCAFKGWIWLRRLFLHALRPGEAPAGSRHNDVNDDLLGEEESI